MHLLIIPIPGVLLMAKDKEMATYLSSLMKHHKVTLSILYSENIYLKKIYLEQLDSKQEFDLPFELINFIFRF